MNRFSTARDAAQFVRICSQHSHVFSAATADPVTPDRRSRMPAAIGAPPKPMMALSRAALPTGSQWTYEVKWDGYRTIALKDGRQVRLFSRNLKDVTAQYPSIAAAVAGVHAPRAMLDGELVALDDDGRPSFQALHHQTPSALVYYVFDVLELNGRSLIDAPLEARRRHLPALVSGTPVLFSEPLPGRPG